jgi:hypothetical protein
LEEDEYGHSSTDEVQTHLVHPCADRQGQSFWEMKSAQSCRANRKGALNATPQQCCLQWGAVQWRHTTRRRNKPGIYLHCRMQQPIRAYHPVGLDECSLIKKM